MHSGKTYAAVAWRKAAAAAAAAAIMIMFQLSSH